MKTKTTKQTKVNVVTLGCSKNLVDSEILMHQLKENEYDVSHDSNNTDHEVVVINTCGFIDNAKEESINTILQYAGLKDDGLIEKLYVTGCLSERYKEDLESEIPQVDAFFGTRELPRLLKTMGANYKEELLGERLIGTPSHYAYLKISEGCDKKCAFCAIPLMRGKHISKPIEKLVKEAESLAAKGVKELILIAQELTYYGKDIYNERKLSSLLRALSKVEGIEWIRLHYAYPSNFPLDVLDEMRENEKICNYIDIPLQHISDKLLKMMRRGTNKKSTYLLIDEFRKRVPGIAIRTTLLVGHPGETEQDFQELCEFVQKAKLDRLGVFTYSHEENTHAFQYKDDISDDVKQERAQHIMDLQQEISLEHNNAKLGKKEKVLFDRLEGDYFIGRTQFDSPDVDNEVLLPRSGNYVRIGDFADVKIIKAHDFDLVGALIDTKK